MTWICPDPKVLAKYPVGTPERVLLAVTALCEARSPPPTDDIAVMHVILNRRKRKGRFPNSVRGVVFQRSQFSCFATTDPNLKVALDPERYAQVAYRTLLDVADGVLAGTIVDQTCGADHYVTESYYRNPLLCPKWATGRKVTSVLIGPHRFFRGVA